MKQNIIMVIILIALFFFGLLIYDFSDELEATITKNDWYRVEEKQMLIMSFRDNRFSYIYEVTGLTYGDYESCETFRFNRSINVIRLNCGVKGNKIRLSKIDEDEKVIVIERTEKTFHNSRENAINANFIIENELTEEAFNSLMNYDLNIFNQIRINRINNFHNSRENTFIALVYNRNSIQNALNIRVLSNYVDNISILIVDELNENEYQTLTRLNKDLPADLDYFDQDTIPVFRIGNQRMTLVHRIEVIDYPDINNYEDFLR